MKVHWNFDHVTQIGKQNLVLIVNYMEQTTFHAHIEDENQWW